MLKQTLAAGAATSILLSGLSANVHAQEKELSEPVVTYGANLDTNQKDETRKLLGADNDTTSYTVDSKDMAKYTNEYYNTVYSSTYISPKKFGGKGVEVDIVTPENITNVSASQYENAAISAGIQDANIKVGAVVETLGYGALSGIYKAMDEQGAELNPTDMRNAQEEQQTLSKISDENKNKDNYNDKAMNGAVADMKSQVAQNKADNQEVSDSDVENIVDDTLKDKGLSGDITDNQRQELYDVVKNARDSHALNDNPEAYKDQVDSLKDKLSSAMDKAKEKAQSAGESEQGQGFWDKVKNFFKNLF